MFPILVPAAQQLLFPDPQPLVERLGREFFRTAPEAPGVYLMRDAVERVLYVGKAKNLRKRLGSYRVANPDRMPRRHLRLLREVMRIELRRCPDEATALTCEADLLRTLKPRFNRVGTWSGSPRFLVWRRDPGSIELMTATAPESGWRFHGPIGGARVLRGALVRLLWCAFHPTLGYSSLPSGWFHGEFDESARIQTELAADVAVAEGKLEGLFFGEVNSFCAWIREQFAGERHPFEQAAFEADLEFLGELKNRFSRTPSGGITATREAVL